MSTRLAGALLLATAVVLLPAGTAAADTQGEVVSTTFQDGQVDMVLATKNLPGGVTLDPTSAQVTIDGQPVDATVAPLSSIANPLPQRRTMLVIDTSGSMAGSGIAGARVAAQAFLREVPADVAVGLIAFANRAVVEVAPTTDRDAVQRAVGQLSARGNTTLYDALVLGVRTLGDSGDRSLVVLSDGADTNSVASQSSATDDVRSSGAELAFAAFRTSGSQTATLRAMAGATGGVVVAASDASQLASAFTTAARSFDTRVAITATVPSDVTAGEHTVRAEVAFGSINVSDTSTFTQPASVTNGAVATNNAYVAPVSGRWLLTGVLLLVFLGVLAVATAILFPIRESVRTRRSRDLEFYTLGGEPVQASSAGGAAAHGRIARNVMEFSNRVAERRGWTEKMSLELDRAGMSTRPHEWLIIRTGAILATIAGLTVLAHNLLFGIVVGFGLGWLVTFMYVRIRAGRRLKAFQETLPDALQLIASGLKTGFSLPQALDNAVRDGREPLASELNRALTESRLGVVLEDALDKVAERMDSIDFAWVVMAIRIQREVGGNLAEVLQTTVATMRERAAMRRQVRALSAEGRLSAYILIALPILTFCWLFLSRREYLSLLWTTSMGLVMSVGAVIAIGIGWLWMRKVVQVEV